MRSLVAALFLSIGLFSTLCVGQVIKVFSLEIISYEDSLSLAKNENKEVLVLFTGDYCAWCQKQKDVFLEDQVINKLRKYVVCYVDLSERKDLAKKYNVRTIPSYFIIDEKENIIKKNTGYKDKDEFLDWLKR